MISRNPYLDDCSLGVVWGEPQSPRGPRIQANIDCSVCVIGRSIPGLCVATELCKRGIDVVLLDEDSPRNAHNPVECVPGCFATTLSTPYSTLERTIGLNGCRRIVSDIKRGLDWLEQLVQHDRLSCGFQRVPGTMVVPHSIAVDARQRLYAEQDAADRAGVSGKISEKRTYCESGAPLVGLEFAEQIELSPPQFAAAMDLEIRRGGGRIFTSDPVSSVWSARGEEMAISCGPFKVRADTIIVARESLPASLVGLVRARCVSTSVSLVYELPDTGTPIAPSHLWDGGWSDLEHTHRARLIGGYSTGVGSPQRLLFSAQSSRIHSSETLCASAQQWIREHFRDAGELLGTCRRTADVPENGVPMIGAVRNFPGLFVVLGDAVQSLTYAAIAAIKISDALTRPETETSASATCPFLP